MGLNGGRTVCVLGLLGLMLLAGVAAPTRAAGGGVQPELPITNRIEAITRIVQQMDARLAAQFTERADGLWGVYRFKRGFGGQLHRAAGPWDRVYRDSFYKLYLRWLRKGSGERG